MLLTQEQTRMRDAVRSFAQEQLWPHAAHWDREHTFPRDAHRGLAGLGAYGVCVPQELGGAGLDGVTLALVLEEIAAGDGGTSTAISVANCAYNAILMAYGSAAQQQKWLAPAARGEYLGVFCLNDPHVGSDTSDIRTTAVREGDAYVINGTKQFITNGHNGHAAIVTAVTGEDAGKKRMSAFIVPTHNLGNSGWKVVGLEHKLGQHSSDMAHVLLENCRVPADHLIGREGEGYKIALSALEGGRIGVAAQSVGMARRALEFAVQYAKKNKAFGKAIFHNQAVSFRLADCATRLEAARQLIWHAASLRDAGRPCLKEAAMAKLFASEVAEYVCSAAIQTLGGYGIRADCPVERIYRDVRMCQIYEGSSDVQKLIISRAL